MTWAVKQSATARRMAGEVRRALRTRNVTQEQLVRRVGVDRMLVNRTLNQRGSVGPLPLWDDMARALGGRWVVTLVLDDPADDGGP